MSNEDDKRRGMRARKVATKLATVTDVEKQQAVTARLNALENDNTAAEEVAAASDDEFDVDEESEEERSSEEEDMRLGRGPKRRKKDKRSGSGKQPGKRKTRGMVAEKRRPRNFAALLEEANLEALPAGVPSYLTAAVGPPTTASPRRFCSVCGNLSSYSCTRCSSRFCGRRCNVVHVETQCLKFVA